MKIFLWKNPSQATYYWHRGIINALKVLGHEIKIYNGNIEEWFSFNPDIYIGNNDPSYKQNIPSKEKRGKCKIVMGICRGAERNSQKKQYIENSKIDVFYCNGFNKPNDVGYWNYWISRYPCMFHIQGGDSTFYKKNENIKKKYDFGYVGGYWKQKAQTIDKMFLPILKYYKNYKIYGTGNKGWPNNLSSGRIGEKDEATFLSSCKIIPCFSEPHTHTTGIDIPERMYKAALSGALVLHDNVKDIHKIFPNIITFNSASDLKDKIDYYLNHDEERIKLAEEQRQYILKNHTYLHRIKKMFKVLKIQEEVDRCNKYIENYKNTKISLIIPCIPRDFNSSNLTNTLNSIVNATLLPNETIIVLSGCNQINKDSIELFKKIWTNKLENFKILTYPNIQSCGKNRKIGNMNASNEIIVHADADDIFHPQRLEILHYFFEKTNAMVINHLYIPFSKEFHNYNISKIKLAANSETMYNHYFPKNKWTDFPKNEYYGSFLNMTTTDGHMAFRKEVLEKVNHSDKDNFCDGEFLHKVCYHYKKNIFLNACLSKYSKGDYWINRFPKENGERLKRSLDGEKK